MPMRTNIESGPLKENEETGESTVIFCSMNVK